MTVTPPKPASWSYAESFVAEDEILAAARARAEEVGAVAIGSGGGAALRFLASVIEARAVVEIGTGAGVSGLALFAGMQPDGILTSVDIEPEHQQAARKAFLGVGIPTQRFRLIAGAALNVLPRLSDGAYDLVFIDADKPNFPKYVEQAIRLLKSGGTLVINDALDKDRVSNPAARDATTVVLRQIGKAIRDDERLASAMLPTGDGLLVAVKK